MTPQQINAAIATDLGWKVCLGTRDMPPVWEPKESGWTTELEFTHSLDAIRAAAMERFRTLEEERAFGIELGTLTQKCNFAQWKLTPADWCEAYLRAVGKWSETEAKA